MAAHLVESFELLVAVDQLAPRLEAAATALAQLAGLADEQAWLAAARARLAAVTALVDGALLDRALRLPELEAQKGERGKLLQAAVADGLERLQAGIAHAGGPRSPLLEILFQNLKLPVIRKAGRAELDRFCAEVERRLASSYARRMFAAEPYAQVVPTIKALEAAIATWRAVFVDPPLADAAADALRAELTAAGQGVELAVRQARLLAQAALLPAAELLDGAGVVTAKGKRRNDDHALLEQDPPDPALPSPAERAELEAT
jgi:hypothetical protein